MTFNLILCTWRRSSSAAAACPRLAISAASGRPGADRTSPTLSTDEPDRFTGPRLARCLAGAADGGVEGYAGRTEDVVAGVGKSPVGQGADGQPLVARPALRPPRGLTTSAIHDGSRPFEIEFDFCVHELHVDLRGSMRGTLALEAKSVARLRNDGRRSARAGHRRRDLDQAGRGGPRDPFGGDEEHAPYDPDHANRFWRQLLQAGRVFKQFRGRFVGNVSRLHFFFCGGMKLTVSSFSGRRRVGDGRGLLAPDEQRGLLARPCRGERLLRLCLPIPDGFRDHPVAPADALYSDEFDEFLLAYDAVRTSANPDTGATGVLADHLRGGRRARPVDRRALEDDPAQRARPR
jgi:hypothetical protein